jgi:nitrite reductase/ring-hydroxylating ferredoxin subunit
VKPKLILARTPARNPPDGKGCDFGPYPNGWIALAWSHELLRGQVRPLTALGRELVLFRGEDGNAHVLDAYCPHLGAHLGVGGTVVGNELRCPFHGWQFNGEGACTVAPHARKIPPKAQVPCWLVREVNGLIFVWYDASGRSPWFEMPAIPEYGSSEWTRPIHRAYRIRARWREVLENSLDSTHFPALHNYPAPPTVEFEPSGPYFTVRSKTPWRRFGRDMDVILNFDGFGPGLAVARGVSEAPFIAIGSPTPIDDETIVHRMTVIVSKKIPLALRQLVARFIIYSVHREFERDIPIWESKIYQPRPMLSDADGPIGRFRIWSRQFYEAGGAAAAPGPAPADRREPVAAP